MRASERTCCVCRSKASKKGLARIVMFHSGLVWDEEQRAPGRGAYVHLSADCVSRMGSPGRWEHVLRLSPGSVVREQLNQLTRSMLMTVMTSREQ